MDKKYILNAPPSPNEKLKYRDHVSMTSGTNEIKQQMKLSVELSLHAGSLIDAEKIINVAKGWYGGAISN